MSVTHSSVSIEATMRDNKHTVTITSDGQTAEGSEWNRVRMRVAEELDRLVGTPKVWSTSPKFRAEAVATRIGPDALATALGTSWYLPQSISVTITDLDEPRSADNPAKHSTATAMEYDNVSFEIMMDQETLKHSVSVSSTDGDTAGPQWALVCTKVAEGLDSMTTDQPVGSVSREARRDAVGRDIGPVALESVLGASWIHPQNIKVRVADRGSREASRA
jgi:hypothetical protein